MTNYLSVTSPTDSNQDFVKFNVSENLADTTLLLKLKEVFDIELLLGAITRKNKRVIIKFTTTREKGSLLKEAFISQLKIFENKN